MRSDRQYARIAGAVLLGTLAFRIVLLLCNHNGLHGDEAQYWAWSKDLSGGYYSKPPVIAWLIAASTALFGDGEWAVRLPSPLLHIVAAAFTYGSARRLIDARAGLLAMGLYLFMPGVALSSSLISTDAALLCGLTASIYAWVRLRDTPSLGWAVALGLVVGLSVMSKYAAVYLLPALIGAALFEPRTRAALLHWRGAVTAVVASLVVLPNLLWNARHDFATVRHTGDNANMGDGAALNWNELLEFLGGQLGVFGPLSFVLLCFAVLALRKGSTTMMRWLAVLVVLPIGLICVQAVLSRANANWAAAAYSAAPIILAGWAVRVRWRQRAAVIAVGLNVVVGTVPAVVMTSPALTDALGFANSVKRQRGWPETAQAVRRALEAGEFDALAVDHRLSFYDLRYYGVEDAGVPLRMWRLYPQTGNHAELTDPLVAGDGSVLLLSYYADSYAPYFRDDFDTLEPGGDLEIALGGGKVRRYQLFRASGYRGPRDRDLR